LESTRRSLYGGLPHAASLAAKAEVIRSRVHSVVRANVKRV